MWGTTNRQIAAQALLAAHLIEISPYGRDARLDEDGKTTYEVTYEGVSTLNFSGNEFIGVIDFSRECIIQEISPEKMRLVMFMSATTGDHFNKPALAVIFTFEAVAK